MKNLIMLIVGLFLTNCHSTSEVDKKYSKVLGKDNCSNGLTIIIPTSKTNILIGDNDILRAIIYKENYSLQYNTYLDFLEAFYENTGLISLEEQKQFSNCYIFDRDSDIYKEYQQIGINPFVKKYMISRDKSLELNPALGNGIEPIILKIMFDNKYFILFDDYRAVYIFTKDEPICWNFSE